MANDGNGNKGNGGGGPPKGPQTQKPPTNLEAERLRRENEALKTQMSQLTGRLGMQEGPMGRNPDSGSMDNSTFSHLSYEEEQDLHGLLGADGSTRDIGDWSLPSVPLGEIPPTGACALQVQEREDLTFTPEKTSWLKKTGANTRAAIAVSPVKSIISRIFDWRIIGIAAAVATIDVVRKLIEYPQKLSFSGITGQYGSTIQGIFDTIASPITSTTGINFGSWSGAGTLFAYTAAISCAVSAFLNRKSLAKIANRISSSVALLALPHIASEVGTNLSTGPRNFDNMTELGPEATAMVYAVVVLRAASWFLPNDLPLVDRVKKWRNSGSNNASTEQNTGLPSPVNAHGQNVPTDANGWPQGTETWATQNTQSPSPAQMPAQPKPQTRREKAFSAIKAAPAALFAATLGKVMTSKAAKQEAAIQAEIQAAREAVGAAVSAWETGDTVSDETEDTIGNFMCSAGKFLPAVWAPLFKNIITNEPSGFGMDDAQKQFNRLVGDTRVTGAVRNLLDYYVSDTSENIVDSKEQSEIDAIDIGELRYIYGVLLDYAYYYDNTYSDLDDLLSTAYRIETNIMRIEQMQS